MLIDVRMEEDVSSKECLIFAIVHPATQDHFVKQDYMLVRSIIVVCAYALDMVYSI